MKRTENYNLPQFEPEDTYRLEDYNEAYEKIDTKIKELQDLIATWTEFKNNGGTIEGNIYVDKGGIKYNNEYDFMALANSEKEILHLSSSSINGAVKNDIDLGTPTKPFKDVYSGNIHCGNIYSHDTVVYKNGVDSMICNDSKGGSIGIQTYCKNGDVPLVVFTSGEKQDDSTFRPNTANNLKIGLGSAQARWRELYFGDYYRDLNGYTDLPNGMKIVWGNFDIYMEPNSCQFKAVTFSKEFKSQVFFSGANCRLNITDSGSGWADNMTVNCCNTALNSASIAIRYNGNTAKSFKVCWFAVGI